MAVEFASIGPGPHAAMLLADTAAEDWGSIGQAATTGRIPWPTVDVPWRTWIRTGASCVTRQAQPLRQWRSQSALLRRPSLGRRAV